MTARIPFSLRAESCLQKDPDTNPLKIYLFRLMDAKRTNLCLSADVSSTTTLLQLADICGPYICLFKTHADIIDDFGPRTIKGLRELSQKHKFLIFEDRKFGDIGATVQSQYTRGSMQIASWAHIVNAHVFPGPSIVTALKQAALGVLEAEGRGVVSTEVWVGTPEHSEDETATNNENAIDNASVTRTPLTRAILGQEKSNPRKDSIIANTTISQTFETAHARQRPQSLSPSTKLKNQLELKLQQDEEDLRALTPPPARALLLFAQMSSEGNLMNEDYTTQTLKMGRNNKDFVIGYIAQRNLNDTAMDDDFLSLTPGVQLPQQDQSLKGDGLGQQYRTPAEVVGKDGCDIVIVGRGIIKAKNKAEEAKRYRDEAWKAYMGRLK
ncbi:MAG: hypothetical protein GOMPHAMPRED_005866 [Gomphillus americanus]|uniref:Orotidine 5'-phosphate decarboxylase n=1 Tax=Gomphillus americanus TaxID=1940652 RepID=A0A8H3IWL1_9LECA|nr:MAG: hypothetical protein GOMPHAMPRED_005866 [Gomphillus americanus]